MNDYLTPTLNTAVIERLDYLDLLVNEGDEPSRASLATTEIARLTDAWRALLELHAPDEHGRCPECSGWRRPRRHPCTVWATAHRHLIAADVALPEQRRTVPTGRPERRRTGGTMTRTG